MRIEIVVKDIDDSYENFEKKVNEIIIALKIYKKKILDVNLFYDGKKLIAVIKCI
jgi:uncharacterized protein YaaN involved in tellurite resistance